MHKVQFRKGKNGLWYFKITAANGEAIGQGEGYDSLGNARRGYLTLKHAMIEDITQAIEKVEPPGD